MKNNSTYTKNSNDETQNGNLNEIFEEFALHLIDFTSMHTIIDILTFNESLD